MLADRFGTRRTLAFSLGIWPVFTALAGAAFSYGSLLVVRAVLGVAKGVFPAASMKAVSERTLPQQRMTANA